MGPSYQECGYQEEYDFERDYLTKTGFLKRYFKVITNIMRYHPLFAKQIKSGLVLDCLLGLSGIGQT